MFEVHSKIWLNLFYEKFFVAAFLVFLINGGANAEEVFKCKKGLHTITTNDYDENAFENGLRLSECWDELDKKSKKTQKYFLKSDIFVFIYNSDTDLYLSADSNAEGSEIPAVEKGLKLCGKDSSDCAVWTAHKGYEISYMYKDGKLDIGDEWLQHAYKRRIEMMN